MIKKSIQQRITTGKFVLPAVLLLSIAIWFVVYFIKPVIGASQVTSPFWQLIEPYLPGGFFTRIISYLLYAFVGYFLIELNNAFAIIRLRTSIQSSIYFIIIAFCPELHPLHVGNVAALCMVISIYFLFQSYQKTQSSGILFNSWFFLGLSSLLFPQLLFLVPLYLLGAYNFQSLNFKSFFAGIIGLMLPFWFLLGYAFSFNHIELFYRPFQNLCTFAPINFFTLKTAQIATTGFIIFIFIIALIHSLVTGWQDKIRTRSYLNFLSLMGICLLVLLCLQPQHFISIFPLLLVSFSFLAGHFFALTSNRGSNLFFIFSLVGSIVLFAYNLWML